MELRYFDQWLRRPTTDTAVTFIAPNWVAYTIRPSPAMRNLILSARLPEDDALGACKERPFWFWRYQRQPRQADTVRAGDVAEFADRLERPVDVLEV